MPCTTVTIEEPTPDESEINITNFEVSVENRNETVVNYTVNNNVTSGSGENLGVALSVTVDGSEVDNETTSVPAGSSVDRTTRVTDMASGEHQVCVEYTTGSPNMGNL